MIRQMTIQDYPQVVALWSRSSGIALNDYDDSEQRIAAYLRRNPTTCFVWEEAEKVVGVILAGHDGRRGFIYHATVDQTRRGEGIGTALLSAAVEALKAQGIHKAGMLVIADNADGNTYWEKQGWERRTDVYYRNKILNKKKDAE